MTILKLIKKKHRHSYSFSTTILDVRYTNSNLNMANVVSHKGKIDSFLGDENRVFNMMLNNASEYAILRQLNFSTFQTNLNPMELRQKVRKEFN